MAAKKKTRGRRCKRGRGAGDFFAGFAAPLLAGYDVITGHPDRAVDRFTTLGSRLEKGFKGGRSVKTGKRRKRCWEDKRGMQCYWEYL